MLANGVRSQRCGRRAELALHDICAPPSFGSIPRVRRVWCCFNSNCLRSPLGTGPQPQGFRKAAPCSFQDILTVTSVLTALLKQAKSFPSFYQVGGTCENNSVGDNLHLNAALEIISTVANGPFGGFIFLDTGLVTQEPLSRPVQKLGIHVASHAVSSHTKCLWGCWPGFST